jgi:hypothetical protein
LFSAQDAADRFDVSAADIPSCSLVHADQRMTSQFHSREIIDKQEANSQRIAWFCFQILPGLGQE